MAQEPIRFQDGAAYERGMGVWSAIAGNVFLDWLAPKAGLRWVDVGCGSGAFSELLVQRCAPAEVRGVDPSDAQLAFARTRPAASLATFVPGNAMALPFEADRFDAAVMALVIFFVPEPARGVAEMVRVVRPGGLVTAYAWDMEGGGFPFAPIHIETRALGFMPPLAPNPDASRLTVLTELWTNAGLESVETREITIRRTFADFDEFWRTSTGTGGLKPLLDSMTPQDIAQLRTRVRARLSEGADGKITGHARANAIRGRVPKS